MAMTAWAAKFCDQLDLLVGEGTHLLPKDGYGSHHAIVLQQGHNNERPRPGGISQGNHARSAVEVALVLPNVGNVEYLPCRDDSTNAACGVGTK